MKKDQLLICKFIKYLDQNYKEQVDIVFLIDYFKFQFSHYVGIKTKYGTNAIMIQWIIGPKAIERWKTRDVRKKWIVRVKLKNEVELKFVKTYNKILKQNSENRFIQLHKYEEDDKQRFHNTGNGFQYCLYNTTLYNPLSNLCLSCLNNDKCKKILSINHPNLYKQRINE
jgi:hypothetical protein